MVFKVIITLDSEENEENTYYGIVLEDQLNWITLAMLSALQFSIWSRTIINDRNSLSIIIDNGTKRYLSIFH